MERIKSETTYYSCMEHMLRQFQKRGRRDAFTGTTREAHQEWQQKERQVLHQLLGLSTMESCELRPKLLETAKPEEGIRREKWIIQVEPEVWMPFYILIPDKVRETDMPCVLALPGHQGGGKYSVAGVSEYGAIADKIEFFHYDYGLRMAREGFVTFCPDNRGFGERRELALQKDTEEAFLGSTCFHLAHMAEPLGQTVIGQCTWDSMRLIDYIEQRGEWDCKKVGCVGFSGGGMQTLWLSALDERVGFAMISGYLYGYADSLLKLNGNCSCNYVPHLWEHLDMGDIGSLIAPRPVMIQSCRGDHLNGERGLANVREQVEVMRQAYWLYEAEDVLFHDIREGEHCFHWEGAEAFLHQVLLRHDLFVEKTAKGSLPTTSSGNLPMTPSGSERFEFIEQALKAAESYAGDAVTIHLAPGRYEERLVISQPYLTLQGAGREKTVITGALYAKELLEDGEKRGTFRTYTVLVDGDYFRARDLTLENTAGPGMQVGQALALYLDADCVTLERCRLLGGQDTLFTAPLPQKEREPHGFRGPKEFTPRKPQRQLFLDCEIAGDVDFIFGGATAWFERCRLVSNDTGRPVNGYVTAASTPRELSYGYVFQNCSFESSCAPGTVYLGRPWREDARVVILNSRLGAHIRPEGWEDWGKPHERFFFAEYGNVGPGADLQNRADFVHLLSEEEAQSYTRERVLGDWSLR